MVMLAPEGAVKLIVTDQGEDIEVGWRVTTKDFQFDAIVQKDGTVKTYVEWGDDMGGEMARHDDMSDARTWFDTLMKATA